MLPPCPDQFKRHRTSRSTCLRTSDVYSISATARTISLVLQFSRDFTGSLAFSPNGLSSINNACQCPLISISISRFIVLPPPFTLAPLLQQLMKSASANLQAASAPPIELVSGLCFVAHPRCFPIVAIQYASDAIRTTIAVTIDEVRLLRPFSPH
ncbi:hypothetical protein BD779DRAFT_437708 [Infundibulicybe gibba]|nr:hypothetical protein BD779DRAFT_437708 [Infundibulicybe gibba]